MAFRCRCVREADQVIVRPDGSLWVSIDDWQVHYLKVALDEVFVREICYDHHLGTKDDKRKSQGLFQ